MQMQPHTINTIVIIKMLLQKYREPSCEEMRFECPKNKFYPRSRDRQNRASDELFYLLFCYIFFDSMSMLKHDKTAKCEPYNHEIV